MKLFQRPCSRESGNAKIVVPVVIAVMAAALLWLMMHKGDDAIQTPPVAPQPEIPQERGTVERAAEQDGAAEAEEAGQKEYGYTELLPYDTFAYMGLSDVRRSLEEYRATALHAIWNEPEVQELVAVLRDEIVQIIGQRAGWGNGLGSLLSGDAGLQIGEFLDMFHGELALALTGLDLTGPGGPTPHIVLIADAHANASEIDSKMDMLATMLMAAHPIVTESTYDYQGVTISLLSGNHQELVRTIYRDTFLLAWSRAPLHAVLDRMQEGDIEQSLAAHESFNALRDKIGRGSEWMQYLGLREVLDKFAVLIPGNVSEMMKELGVYDIQSLGMATTIHEQGFVDKVYVHIPDVKPEHRKGLTKLLERDPVPESMLNMVPEDAVGFSAMNISIAAIWEEAKRILGVINPQALEQIVSRLNQAQRQTNIDFEGDVIGNLSEGIVVSQLLPEPGDSMDVVVAFGLNNADAFGTILTQTVLPLVSFMVQFTTEEHMGKTLYGFSFPNPRTQVPMTFSFVVTDSHLIAGASVASVKKAMEQEVSPATSIVANPVYQASKKHISSAEGSILSFGDMARSFESNYRNIDQALTQLSNLDADLRIDKSLLPRPDTIAKHLFPFVGCLAIEEQGVFGEDYTVVPAPVTMTALGVMGAATVGFVRRGVDVGNRTAGGPGGDTRTAGPATQDQPAVVNSLRALAQAQDTHRAVEGRYASLLELCHAEPPYLEQSYASGRRNGYRLSLTVGEDGWSCHASPIDAGSGQPFYFVDESGTIRSAVGKAADAHSQPIQ